MTIDQLIQEIKNCKPFPYTFPNGIKGTARFLNDDEMVQSGDYQVHIGGPGFRPYNSREEVINLFSKLDVPKKYKHQVKTKSFLLANPQYFHKGRQAWIIASVAHDDYAGFVQLTTCQNGIAKNFPSFVFIRSV
ncbi:hypothetical protein [Aeromonas phage AerS_266]|nr:hypothetical protein [Aeromonas phage AerS_266]